MRMWLIFYTKMTQPNTVNTYEPFMKLPRGWGYCVFKDTLLRLCSQLKQWGCWLPSHPPCRELASPLLKACQLSSLVRNSSRPGPYVLIFKTDRVLCLCFQIQTKHDLQNGVISTQRLECFLHQEINGSGLAIFCKQLFRARWAC